MLEEKQEKVFNQLAGYYQHHMASLSDDDISVAKASTKPMTNEERAEHFLELLEQNEHSEKINTTTQSGRRTR